jgi:hypothetical protein
MYEMILKSVLLFVGVFIVMPVVFFILVGCCGRWFSLSVDKDSWFARTNNKFIKHLFH